MASALTSQDVQQAWSALVEDVRTAVLLTLRNGRPFGSHVPVCVRIRLDASLSASQSTDAPHAPFAQRSPRVAVHRRTGRAREKPARVEAHESSRGGSDTFAPHAPPYDAIKEQYLARFPQTEMMFSFGDFALWELRLEDAHFVLGFGQAFVSTATTPVRWVHQKVERPSTRKE
jgi:putative heme iron utilization protein